QVNQFAGYAALKQYNKAIADYSEPIRLSPKWAWPWFRRGNAYSELGKHDKAIADYDKAIELESKPVSAWYNRGNAYNRLGQPEKAIADLSRAIELDHVDAHNSLAWLLATYPDAKVRDPDRAVKLAKKAVQLVPLAGGSWNTLGVAHYRAGDWKAAVAAL